ncbi:DUF4286 family protein [Bacteroidia bacterium]|jgi:hypothetical protein|nr:DUF4286 family protein [Bacteroidia bacterium]
MIIYNVTLSINPTMETSVIQWLKEEHIPEVLETGFFLGHDIFKVIENPKDRKHNSYAVQYKLESWAHFNTYALEHADRLKEITQQKFGENVLAFRTFLEKC